MYTMAIKTVIMFASDLLNTCWVEDILNLFKTDTFNKASLNKVYKKFLKAENYCDMQLANCKILQKHKIRLYMQSLNR